jgi:hypothetical protein
MVIEVISQTLIYGHHLRTINVNIISHHTDIYLLCNLKFDKHQTQITGL